MRLRRRPSAHFVGYVPVCQHAARGIVVRPSRYDGLHRVRLRQLRPCMPSKDERNFAVLGIR